MVQLMSNKEDLGGQSKISGEILTLTPVAGFGVRVRNSKNFYSDPIITNYEN